MSNGTDIGDVRLEGKISNLESLANFILDIEKLLGKYPDVVVIINGNRWHRGGIVEGGQT